MRSELEQAMKGVGYLIQQVLEKNKEMEASIKWLEKSVENQGIVIEKLGEKVLTDQDRMHIGDKYRKNDPPSPTPVRIPEDVPTNEEDKKNARMDIDVNEVNEPAVDSTASCRT